VTDERQVVLEAHEQIAADDLGVVKIELNFDVGPVDPADQVGRVFDAGEKIIGSVARVDWLDEKLEAARSGKVGGAGQIVDEDFFGGWPLLRWDCPGEAVDRDRADRTRIVKRLLE
jgi:hypothetical protein